MRQLFTSTPSSKTLHEPHSPSPQPSLAPVRPRSCRNTSNRRSIAYACTVTRFPLTVSVISLLADSRGSSLMDFSASGPRAPDAPRDEPWHQKCPLEAEESHRRKRPAHLERH